MKTKVEIRLGATQVTALAVGTAVFSALLFVAGYTVGKSRVPTVAPQPDLQRVLSAVSEERTASRPAVAAIGEVEFMFPKSTAGQKRTPTPQAHAGEVVSAKKQAAALRAAKPKGAAPLAPVAVARPKETSVRSTVGEEVSAKAKVADGKAAPEDDNPPKPKVLSTSQRVAQESKRETKLEQIVKQKPERAADDEDAPAAENDLIPELSVPKLAVAGKSAKLGKTKRVPKVDTAITAAKTRAAKRKTQSQAETKPQKARLGEGRFTLQVKATKSKGEADDFMRALRRKNFFPHLIVVDTPKKGRFYRIRVGRFETMDEARAFQREFGARSGQSESGYVTRL
ncbi:MAG: SPOR domain-containing protein [Bradymonadia bacterium]